MTSRIPTGLAPFIADAPQVGRVEQLVLRPKRRGDVLLVDAWDLRDAAADHARSKKRAVTLIQQEHLAVMSSLLGRPVEARALRRNVVVSGINLLPLKHATFSVGEVVLRGTIACDPCSRMQQVLGPGGYAAMWGHGGICASIVAPGIIRLGDEVRLLDFSSPDSN